jgi:hypothetical protein
MPSPFEPAGDALNPAEAAAVLENIAAGSLELFQRLPASGRAWILHNVIEPAVRAGSGDKAAMEALYAHDYERIPPDPVTFLDSPDYVGGAAKELFPAWRPVVLKACEPLSGIYEMNLTGASSLGKTTAAVFVLAYKIARLLCLRDAAVFYGLQARTKIYIGLYAITKNLVKQVGFYDLRDKIIDSSPFFRDVYPRVPHGNEYIRWETKPIEVLVGSSELHAIGRSLFALLADELNYFAQGARTANRARELVAEVSRRLEGRFVQEGGDMPGIAIYVSQTRTRSDYLEQRIREKRGAPGVMCVRGPRWAFNPMGYHRDRNRGFRPDLGDPFFRTFVGTDVTDPKILDTVARQPDGTYFVEPIDSKDKPSEELVLKVPIVHYSAFKDDVHGALRMLGDVPSGAFTPFFPRHEAVAACFDESLPFPFSAQKIPCYERAAAELQDSFDIKAVTRVYMGRLRPLRHPDAGRYIHLDLAQGAGGQADLAGMAMVHSSGHYISERDPESDAQAGVGSSEVVMNVEVDFYVALTGGPYGESIDFRKVRKFIGWLRNCGFHIKLVTSDQFQSFDMLQRLREAGFQTDRQSVDKTSQPYRVLRGAASEGRLALPWPPGVMPVRVGLEDARDRVMEALPRVHLYREVTGLEHDVQKDKVDHRAENPDGSKGSKDVADGLAGATYRCLADTATVGEMPTGGHVPQQSRVLSSLNRYIDKA